METTRPAAGGTLRNSTLLLLPLGAAAALLALALGYYIGQGPGWLAFDPERVSPLHLIGLMFGAAAAAYVLRRPEWGLLLVAAVLYTNVSEIGARYYGLPSILQITILLTSAAFAARLASRGAAAARRLVVGPVLLLLLLYCSVLFASSVVAADSELADERLFDHVKGVLVFILITNLATSHAIIRRVLWALVLSGALLGTISLFQVLTGSYDQAFGGFGRVKLAQIVGDVFEPRIAGTLSDPNFYAQILVALVPLALFRLLDEPSWRLKVAAAYSLAAIAGALVFTYSRGAFLALAAVLVLSVVARGVRPRYLLGAGVLAVVMAALAPAELGGRLGTLGQLLPGLGEEAVRVDSSIQQRRLLMQSAWEMFSSRPLTGVGAGNYSVHYEEFAQHIGSPVKSYENLGAPRYPHNLYLEILAETGLPGALAFAAVILSALLYALSAAFKFKRSGDRHASGLATSIALGLVAYLVSSLFLHGHYVHYLWLLVALAASSGRAAQAEAYEVRSVVVPDTNILEVSVEGPDAHLAAGLANAAADQTQALARGLYEVYGVRVLDRAAAPRSPARPGLARSLAAGAALGLLSGLALALAFDYLRRLLSLRAPARRTRNPPDSGAPPPQGRQSRPLRHRPRIPRGPQLR